MFWSKGFKRFKCVSICHNVMIFFYAKDHLSNFAQVLRYQHEILKLINIPFAQRQFQHKERMLTLHSWFLITGLNKSNDAGRGNVVPLTLLEGVGTQILVLVALLRVGMFYTSIPWQSRFVLVNKWMWHMQQTISLASGECCLGLICVITKLISYFHGFRLFSQWCLNIITAKCVDIEPEINIFEFSAIFYSATKLV